MTVCPVSMNGSVTDLPITTGTSVTIVVGAFLLITFVITLQNVTLVMTRVTMEMPQPVPWKDIPQSTPTYMLANYSRYAPWVMCANKLNQTNYSDTTLAPLQYPVRGYMSTVSQCIVCRTEYHVFKSNTSAV